jgi:hypothetical protein
MVDLDFEMSDDDEKQQQQCFLFQWHKKRNCWRNVFQGTSPDIFILDRTGLLGSDGINMPILGSDRIGLDQYADPPQHNFYLSSERFPIDDQLLDVYALQL